MRVNYILILEMIRYIDHLINNRSFGDANGVVGLFHEINP